MVGGGWGRNERGRAERRWAAEACEPALFAPVAGVRGGVSRGTVPARVPHHHDLARELELRDQLRQVARLVAGQQQHRDGALVHVSAPGPAGARANIAFYKERGYDAIPPRGPLAALTVPGAIGGWTLALEAAKALGGKMPLDVLLASAIRQARDGRIRDSGMFSLLPGELRD